MPGLFKKIILLTTVFLVLCASVGGAATAGNSGQKDGVVSVSRMSNNFLDLSIRLDIDSLTAHWREKGILTGGANSSGFSVFPQLLAPAAIRSDNVFTGVIVSNMIYEKIRAASEEKISMKTRDGIFDPFFDENTFEKEMVVRIESILAEWTKARYTSQSMMPSARNAGHQAWLDAHTFNVTATEIYQYDSGKMSSETVYVSEELRAAFGTDTLRKISSCHVINTPDNMTLTVICPAEKKQIIVTRQSEPFPWWTFGYSSPCYLWECYENYAFLEDPVNLIWKETDIETVRSIFVNQNPGWVGDGVAEKDYKVYDRDSGGWVPSRSVADSAWRVRGGYHVRLYELADGTVIAGAHKDCPVPHDAIQFEPFERHVAEILEKADGNWTTLIDKEYLGNENTVVLNNGYATVICNGDDAGPENKSGAGSDI